jgi:hypothetical protein
MLWAFLMVGVEVHVTTKTSERSHQIQKRCPRVFIVTDKDNAEFALKK